MHLKTLGSKEHNESQWSVGFHAEFASEFVKFPESVRRQVLALGKLLEDSGPQLARPHADTLKGSTHTNMKELRFNADNGVWRVAFAFDVTRKAIMLVAGDKAGISQEKFYRNLIATADRRFDQHQKALIKREKKS